MKKVITYGTYDLLHYGHIADGEICFIGDGEGFVCVLIPPWHGKVKISVSGKFVQVIEIAVLSESCAGGEERHCGVTVVVARDLKFRAES